MNRMDLILNDNKVIVIAEIGVNHNGDEALASEMIKRACESGADVVKFQTAIPELVQTSNAPKAKYQIENTQSGQSALEMTRSFHFKHEVFGRLKSEVESLGKIFMSTAFDMESLEFLIGLGATTFKIPSGEITNLTYLRRISEVAEYAILSTGMSNLDEVMDAYKVLSSHHLEPQSICVMQCNTAYPTPDTDVNLRVLNTYKDVFGPNIGYSDHTEGILASLVAVSLGSRIIEKHFTVDKSLPGPDQKASLDPIEFKSLVESIRRVESQLGLPIKVPTKSEQENISIARRGLYATTDLPAGTRLTAQDIVALRPVSDISPMEIDKLKGRTLKVPVAKESGFAWNQFDQE